MGDDKDGNARLLQAAQRGDQRLLAFLVEIRVRLVEHDEARIAVERSRERDALPLAGGEQRPTLAHLGVVAFRQPQDQLVHMGSLRGANHFRRVALGKPGDVRRHGAGEELDVLRQVAKMRPEPLARPRRDVGAVEANDARHRLPNADHQSREGRFPGGARTDDAADGFAEVLTARGSDRILGATIVGRDAGEQLSPLVLALTRGLGLKRLGSLVLPYPTRSEYLRRILDSYSRTRLTPFTARTLRWWLARTL